MKYGIIVCAIALIFAVTPVFANDCATEIAVVEAAINSANNVSLEKLEMAKLLLEQAKRECRADTAETMSPGLALLAEAKVLLGI